MTLCNNCKSAVVLKIGFRGEKSGDYGYCESVTIKRFSLKLGNWIEGELFPMVEYCSKYIENKITSTDLK